MLQNVEEAFAAICRDFIYEQCPKGYKNVRVEMDHCFEFRCELV